MTAKAATKRKSGEGDRRAGADRRRLDVVAPGKPERRRNVESRKPEVVELEMSSSEWGALAHDPLKPVQ